MEITNELKEIISPGKTALLVWDVQNRLVSTIFNRDEFLANTNKLIARAREKDVPVIFSKSTPLSDRYASPVMKFIWRERFKKMAQAQAPNGQDLTIPPLENDIVIPKNTASMFVGTNFELILRNAGLTTIVFTGIATEFGVESSARDASNRGFFPVIATDAVSSFDQEGHKRSLANMAKMMILLSTEEIIKLW